MSERLMDTTAEFDSKMMALVPRTPTQDMLHAANEISLTPAWVWQRMLRAWDKQQENATEIGDEAAQPSVLVAGELPREIDPMRSNTYEHTGKFIPRPTVTHKALFNQPKYPAAAADKYIESLQRELLEAREEIERLKGGDGLCPLGPKFVQSDGYKCCGGTNKSTCGHSGSLASKDGYNGEIPAIDITEYDDALKFDKWYAQKWDETNSMRFLKGEEYGGSRQQGQIIHRIAQSAWQASSLTSQISLKELIARAERLESDNAALKAKLATSPRRSLSE